MRTVLIALLAGLALTIPDAVAQQGASGLAACPEIQDSLLRLRCFDEAAKTSPAKPTPGAISPPVGKTAAPDFTKYAVAPYRGPVSYPDFRGREREHAAYRTRILAGAKSGPNFAGHLAMVEIGCGSGCRFVPVVDVQTGHVVSFPLGGEDHGSLDLKYRVDSRLVSARWVSGDRCKREDVVWSGTSFQRGAVNDIGDSEVCYKIED